MAEQPTCASCGFWQKDGAPLATAVRHGAPRDGLGICTFNPPTVVQASGFVTSLFPEVHASRYCGGWEPPVDPPEPGERAPNNILPFDRSVA